MNKGLMKKLLIFLAPIFLLAASVGTYMYANKIIGVYSVENFLDNGDFEKNTYGVGKTGAGSTAFSVLANQGIYGNALQITTPQAGDSITFSMSNNIGTRLSGLNCEAQYNLKLFTTPTAPTVVTVDVMRTAGSVVISNTQTITLSTDAIWYPISVNFPCSSVISATNLRVNIVTAGTTGSGTPIILVDELFAMRATNITNQVVVTDWQDFPSVAAGTLITATTTNPSYGTVVTNKAQYRYVGTDVEIKWDYRPSSAGTTGSGYYLLNVPSSICVIDLTKVKANSTIGGTFLTEYGDGAVGTFSVHDASGTGIGIASVFSSSQLRFNYQYAAGSSSSAGGWSSSFGGLNQVQAVSVNAKVPCVGRSATQSAITQQCIQDGSCENTFSAKVSSAGVVSDENIDWINGNASLSDTSYFTITLKTGFFAATPKCWANLDLDASSSSFLAEVISTSTTSIAVRTLSGGVKFANGFTVFCTRGSTDYKPRFSAPALVGSVTSNASGALRIEGVKISSTGVVTYETSDWISGNCSGSSPYACTINMGVFSSAPVCTATSGVGAAFTAETFTVLTATAFTIQKIGNNAGATEVICIGPR